MKGEAHIETKEELNALKQEVETLNKKLAELTEEELKQVSGGDGDMPCVTELTDELIKSGNFLVSNDGFWYKNEYYEVISANRYYGALHITYGKEPVHSIYQYVVMIF